MEDYKHNPDYKYPVMDVEGETVVVLSMNVLANVTLASFIDKIVPLHPCRLEKGHLMRL